MKKENSVLLALTILTTLTTGCARNYAGTYTGTQIATFTSVAAAGMNGVQGPSTIPGNVSTPVPTTSPMTLTINSNSGVLLTGTWTSQGGQSGTFQGTASGDSITAIMLNFTGTPGATAGLTGGIGSYPIGSPNYNPAVQMGLCNSLTGNLNLGPNNQLTGSLNVVQTAQSQAASAQNYSAYTCSGTMTVNATKTN